MAVKSVFWSLLRRPGLLEHHQSVVTEQHVDQEASLSYVIDGKGTSCPAAVETDSAARPVANRLLVECK